MCIYLQKVLISLIIFVSFALFQILCVNFMHIPCHLSCVALSSNGGSWGMGACSLFFSLESHVKKVINEIEFILRQLKSENSKYNILFFGGTGWKPLLIAIAFAIHVLVFGDLLWSIGFVNLLFPPKLKIFSRIE